MRGSLITCISILVLMTLGLFVGGLTGSLDRSAALPRNLIRQMAGDQYLFENVENILPRPGIFGWIYPTSPDDMESPKASTLQLFENGTPLGPPHASHQEIQDKGDGRYSYWSDGLRFSASDNSDPRSNGRRYTISQSPEIIRLIVMPGVLLLIVLGWWFYRRQPQPVSLKPTGNSPAGRSPGNRNHLARRGSVRRYFPTMQGTTRWGVSIGCLLEPRISWRDR